ncbi:hypothetical protein KIH39_07995 [Telmatocola sphagniphila]|uniref:Uncharacterized protein n=1 Tax=Telmatocola sphagniphila TaxID=1123043 RepID=A0A8E6EZU4_9BACT|nr:hypothetical protein [Telmatocola sphagniphila]QVL33836.1 hypothetical protein KIH39_07995 [Telmatocola sphagniphila]
MKPQTSIALLLILVSGCGPRVFNSIPGKEPLFSVHPVVAWGAVQNEVSYYFKGRPYFYDSDQELTNVTFVSASCLPTNGMNFPVHAELSEQQRKQLRDFAIAHPAKEYVLRLSSEKPMKSASGPPIAKIIANFDLINLDKNNLIGFHEIDDNHATELAKKLTSSSP